MSNLRTKMTLLVGFAAMALAPAVRADEWNQKTVFTFSGPVAVPGQVLPAGTYVFKLLNSSTNRHIVQVFNKDENHVYGTFLAIPDYRLRPSNKPLVKFAERPAGEPQAIKAWFYPGRSYGHELVYPKTEAVELARLNNTPVPAMPAELTPDTVAQDVKTDAPQVLAIIMAAVMAEKPTGEEVAVESAFPDSPDSAAMQASQEQLPVTASSLPLIAVLGLLSLTVAVALRVTATAKLN
jgi:hypothetical protein